MSWHCPLLPIQGPLSPGGLLKLFAFTFFHCKFMCVAINFQKYPFTKIILFKKKLFVCPIRLCVQDIYFAKNSTLCRNQGPIFINNGNYNGRQIFLRYRYHLPTYIYHSGRPFPCYSDYFMCRCILEKKNLFMKL